MQSYPLKQLAAFCAAHPIGSKVVFVPSAQAGHNLTTALALAGHSHVNVRTPTPAQWAEELVGPGLQAAGWRRLGQDVELLLLEQLAAEIPAEPGGYFTGQLLTGGGMANALQRALRALRLAGIGPEDLRQGTIRRDKASAVARLYEQYLARLEAARLYDEARLYHEALEALKDAEAGTRGADGAQAHAILDETPLPELAFRFVRRAAGSGLYRIGRRNYGVDLPTHCAARRFEAQRIPGEETGQEGDRFRSPDAPKPLCSRTRGRRAVATQPRVGAFVQGDLFDVSEIVRTETQNGASTPGEVAEVGAAGRLLSPGLKPEDADAVGLYVTIGVETEVRGILREVAAAQIPLDQVEVAYTNEAPYRSLLFNTAERYDLPVEFAAGVPALALRPGRALAGFCRWILADFGAQELANLCRSGDIELSRALPADTRLSPHRLASLLSEGRPGRGRDACDRALGQLTASSSDKGPPGDEEAATRHRERVAAAREILGALLRCVPGEHASLRQVTAGAAAFLSDFAPSVGERERRCLTSLTDRLAELGEALNVEEGFDLPWLVQRVLGMTERHTVDASVARPGKLYAAPLERAGYSGRPHLFVLGMDDSHFPGRMAAEDPILHDDERAGLSSRLPLERQGSSGRTWQLVRAAGMCPGRVGLVAHCLSLSDARQPSPTPLFLQAAAELGLDPTLLRPVPDSADDALDEVEELLTQYRHPLFADEVLRRYPHLARGQRAASARAHRVLTRYDGWIRPRSELAVTGGVEGEERPVMSAARLETLARCPYRYFMRYVLQVKPPEEALDDPTRWLHPLEAGLLLHDLFRDFMKELQPLGERPDAERHLPVLLDLLARQMAVWQERVPVIYKAALVADTARLERAAHIFLNAEARRLSERSWVKPVAFEMAFGTGQTAEGKTDEGGALDGVIDHTKSVEVRLSDAVHFRLQGRIDRLDRVTGAAAGAGEGECFEIWDYKTGSTFGFDAADLLAGGSNLQWALYAHAVEAMIPGSRVRNSGYFFAGERGFGQRFDGMPPEGEVLGALLEPLFEMVELGAFFHVQKADQCTFCDYRQVCASERKTLRDVEEMCAATAQLRALAQGMEKLEAKGAQQASRSSLRAYLEEAGIEADDVVPSAAEASTMRWMTGLQPELPYVAGSTAEEIRRAMK